MKHLLTFALLMIFSLSHAFDPYTEDPKGAEFINMYKTYHITPNKNLVSKTIKYINKGLWDEGVFEMRYKAFFSVLFTINPEIKAEFQKKLPKLKNADFLDLFEQLFESSIEQVYENAPPTVDINEMLCYSYYASGDNKYLDKLLELAKDNEERVDETKFMIGANALWCLATIRAEDIEVKKYLESLPENKYAEIALKSRAYDLKNEQLRILEEQKKNMIWK